GATERLADDTAAVCMLPGWAQIMPADGFAVVDQGRDWLAELPGEFATLPRLAVIDLRSLRMHRQYDGFALGRDGVGQALRQRRHNRSSGHDCRRNPNSTIHRGLQMLVPYPIADLDGDIGHHGYCACQCQHQSRREP